MATELLESIKGQDDQPGLQQSPGHGQAAAVLDEATADTPARGVDDTAPLKKPAEILKDRRDAAKTQKSQADVLTQDATQLEKDIAELDALVKEHDKATMAGLEQADRWRKEREATETFQKSRTKAVGEELGDRNAVVVAALGDYQPTVGALHSAVAEAMRRYLDAQVAAARVQAAHDATKAALGVLRQHVTDTQKARQTFDDRRLAGFVALRKQIESTPSPEPAYANLLFLRTELDGVPGGDAAAEPALNATDSVPVVDPSGARAAEDLGSELDFDFDALWRGLDEMKQELRKRRAAASAAKDALVAKQAELDSVVQRRRPEVLKKLEPKN
jgi:hypothetical protein